MTGPIRHLETLALHAWPALEIQECDGWCLRWGAGVTHRANSVWPNAEGGRLSVGEKIAAAEMFYRERGQPPIFQLSPAALPLHLDMKLAQRGYVPGRATMVQIATTSEVSAGTLTGSYRVTVTPRPDATWLSLYREAEGVDEENAAVRADIMLRVQQPSVYAVVWEEAEPVAVGSAVLEGPWAGLFNIATRPVFRRRGAAQAVIHVLTEWARERDADSLYLQVMYDNAAALPLYERLGFIRLYDYHYWRADLPARP